MFKCEYCGKEFDKLKSLYSHYTHCKLYIKKKKTSKSIYKKDDNLYMCECGKEFTNHQSLNAHFRHCLIHKEATGQELIIKKVPKGKMCGWDKFTDDDIKLFKKNAGETLSKKIKNNEIIPGFTGKHVSEEHKTKLRILQANKLKGKGMKMNYSKTACEYINNLNKLNGWQLQHAENGGEIECLGYWLDGYDKTLNIVFEYDEPKHYIDIENNILTDYDIKRQTQIIEKLNCEFWRYNEKLNLLYKVN